MILSIGEDWRPEISGWSVDILPFYHRMAKNLPDGATIVEIGVYHGRSILYLAEQLWKLGKRNCKLTAVDLWHVENFTNEASRAQFEKNLELIGDAKELISILQLPSIEAAQTLKDKNESFDLIFIDAAHDYQSVKNDIHAWSKVLKKDGIIAGHDYWHWGEHAGVGKAVDEYVNGVNTHTLNWSTVEEKKLYHKGLITEGSVWYIRHNKNVRTEWVSVIIPCYKQSEYLKEAIESVLNQTYSNIEIIIACGDDESFEIANSFNPDDICIGAISKLNRGRSHALNKAIDACCGTLILRLDADDKLVPTAIEELVYATPENEPFTITTCNLQKFGTNNEPLITGPFFARNQLNDNYILSCSMYSKKLWNQVKGFEESLPDFEDWEFWIKCIRHLPVVSKVNKILMHYRQHEGQAMDFANCNTESIKAMIRILHPELYGTIFNDTILLSNASEEHKQKIRKFGSWFPTNENAQYFMDIVNSKLNPKIVFCLSMICKNEEKVIGRALESVKDFVDYWLIQDTGSTDTTQDIIYKTMQPNGELTFEEWRNFGYNRNLALRQSRFINKIANAIGYSLILDADDTLEFLNSKEEIVHSIIQSGCMPAYQIELQHGGKDKTYWKIHLVRSDSDFRFEGVTHEVLVSPSNMAIGRLTNIVYHCNNESKRNENPQAKFLEDAKLLEAEFAKDPKNFRLQYYIAQSYRDAEQNGKALDSYRKRVNLGGWAPEVISSMYEIARLYERMGLSQFVAHAYLEAWQFKPTSAEPLYRLAFFYRQQKKFDLAVMIAQKGIEITSIPDDQLIIDKSIYRWRMGDELATSLSWLARYQEAINVYQAMLNNNQYPEDEIERVKEAIEFCKMKMA